MSISIPIALGTLAIGAYANAKFRLSDDFHFLSSWSQAQTTFTAHQKNGKGNPFYRVEEHAQDPRLANEVFLIYEGKSWTFKEYYEVVLRYAGWLHKTHHVVKGEIVALDLMNSPAFCFLVPAIWSLGASPALINYNLVSKSLIHCVRVSTARLLIVDPEIAPKALTEDVKSAFETATFRNNAFPLEYTVIDDGLQKSLNYFPSYRAPDSVRVIENPGAIGTLMYTSGTTGLPKAAIQPWARVATGGRIAANLLRFKSATQKQGGDRFYTCMPLYHTTAFTLGFNACLQNATTLVLGHKFSASQFWPEVREHRVTIIQYVGETLRYLLAAPPSAEDQNHKVRMAWGNGLRPDVWKKFKARFGIPTIAEVYGATEGVAATFNINNNDFTDGAIAAYGKISEIMMRRSTAIVLVDWETEKPWRNPKTGLCLQVPRGEVGELLFMLDPAAVQAKFAGYLNNTNANDGKVLRDVLKKGDAYFRTGDTVRFDKDARLWFSDRIGDTFRWKSENVSTAEVGETLGHHPAVQEANVYGVLIPGHEGRAGCAALLLRPEALETSGATIRPKAKVLESLAVYATNSLPRYAVPLFLRIVEKMVMTGNNKQQKTTLRTEGINLKLIDSTSNKDTIYWLRPGSERYVKFEERDLQSLEGRTIRL